MFSHPSGSLPGVPGFPCCWQPPFFFQHSGADGPGFRGGILWFELSLQEEQPLSQEQRLAIAAHTVPGTQSQTVNGYTIALDSAISDGNRTWPARTLTAPEGTVLDADHYGDLHETVFQFPDLREILWDPFPFGWEVRRYPTDNTVTLFYPRILL